MQCCRSSVKLHLLKFQFALRGALPPTFNKANARGSGQTTQLLHSPSCCPTSPGGKDGSDGAKCSACVHIFGFVDVR
jgi:hypothetical protein